MNLFSSESISKTTLGQFSWYKNPSKINLIIGTLIWLIGIGTIVIDKTNFFHTTFFKSEYFFTYFLILFSVTLLGNMFKNYSKK